MKPPISFGWSFGTCSSLVVQDLRLLRCNMAINQLVPVSSHQPNILAFCKGTQPLPRRSPVDAAGPWLNSQRQPQQNKLPPSLAACWLNFAKLIYRDLDTLLHHQRFTSLLSPFKSLHVPWLLHGRCYFFRRLCPCLLLISPTSFWGHTILSGKSP